MVAAAAPAPAASPSIVDGGKTLMKTWFKSGADTPPAVQVYEPEQPVPSEVPLPPRRAATADASLRMAALPGALLRRLRRRRMGTPRRRSNYWLSFHAEGPGAVRGHRMTALSEGTKLSAIAYNGMNLGPSGLD